MKKIWLAVLMNLFISGLGHLYVGRARRGIIAAALMFVLYVSFGLSGALSQFWAYAFAFLGALALKLFLVVDIVCLVRRDACVEARWYSKVRYYVLYTAAFSLLVSGTAAYRGSLFGFETYFIPTDSMAPTLVKGDYVLVDTRPFQSRSLKVGDIVVADLGKKGKLVRQISSLEDRSVEVVLGNSLQGQTPLSLSRDRVEGKVSYVFFSFNLKRIGLKMRSYDGGLF